MLDCAVNVVWKWYLVILQGTCRIKYVKWWKLVLYIWCSIADLTQPREIRLKQQFSSHSCPSVPFVKIFNSVSSILLYKNVCLGTQWQILLCLNIFYLQLEKNKKNSVIIPLTNITMIVRNIVEISSIFTPIYLACHAVSLKHNKMQYDAMKRTL